MIITYSINAEDGSNALGSVLADTFPSIST